MVNSLSKAIIKLTTGLTPISVGTKFFPTDSMQNEYVELFNYTQTILFELKKPPFQEAFFINPNKMKSVSAITLKILKNT